jgi:hypothetical protein
MSPHVALMEPSDISTMFRIRDDALLPDQAPITCLLFQPPYTPLLQERESERMTGTPGPETLFLKAIDDNGTMMACMRARVMPTLPAAAGTRIPGWREGSVVTEEVWNQCLGSIMQAKSEIFSTKEHICKYLVSLG